MKDLLRLEFRKLKTQKPFYICLAIMLIMILISGVTYKILVEQMSAILDAAESAGAETVPKTLSGFLIDFTSASMFSMLSAIFISIVVCGDYESQTVKNIYARGYSRENFYFSKLVYIFVATTVMFLSAVAFTLVFGGALFGFDGLSGRIFVLIGGQYVVCMSGVALSFAVASAMKKLGGTIAVNIIAPIFIPLLLGLADTALKTDGFKVAEIWSASFLTSLTDINVGTGRFIACILGSIVYIILFIAAGFAVNRKSEV